MTVTKLFDHIEKVDLTILQFVNRLTEHDEPQTIEALLVEAPDWKVKPLIEQIENLEIILRSSFINELSHLKSIIESYFTQYPYYWENLDRIYYWIQNLKIDVISVKICKICDTVIYMSQTVEWHKCRGRRRLDEIDIKKIPARQAPKFYPPYYRDVQQFIKEVSQEPYNIPADYRELGVLVELFAIAKDVRNEILTRRQEEANRVIPVKWSASNGFLLNLENQELTDLLPSRRTTDPEDISYLLQKENELMAEREALQAERPENFRTKIARQWRDETYQPKLKEFAERNTQLRKLRAQLLQKYVLTASFSLLQDEIRISYTKKEDYTGSYQPVFRKGWNTTTNITLDRLRAFETDAELFRMPHLTCYRRGQVTVSGSEEKDTKYSTIYRREGIIGLFGLLKQFLLPKRVPEFAELLKSWYLCLTEYPTERHRIWNRDETGIGTAGQRRHLQVIAKGLLDLFLAH